jgi:uncharacterized protein DUF4440
VKRCPTCNKTFTDRNLSFCIDDGTPLVEVEFPADEVTQVSPSQGGSSSGSPSDQNLPAYQPPRAYAPPGTPPNQSKRKAWPWVLGILALLLLLFVGMGIAAIYFVPKMIREAANDNSIVNANVNRNDRSNSNRNANSLDKNTNDNSAIDEWAPPPADQQQVLAQLTELEHEWTVANINADKKKLNRILADDYVGEGPSGKTHGKAEYLRTIERDTSIQKWDFEDLKVDLNGDRASLSGILTLQIDDKPRSFRFTDKFVWRDGRWQAIGSEVTPFKE